MHPDKIQPIVRATVPSHDETEKAGQILLADREVQWGHIRFEGELHDRATYRYFWSLLQRAWASGITLSADAKAAFFAAEDGA